MIAGLVGSSYSGKSTLAKYLEEYHSYQRVDLNNLQSELLPVNEDGNVPASTDPCTEEESKEAPNRDDQVTKVTDVAIISKILNKIMEIDWRKNWVIYPLPMTQEIQNLLKSSRMVIYRVEAPLDKRFQRSKMQDLQ